MRCESCESDAQKRFTAEIAIHFPGRDGIHKRHVFVFPELLVCLSCGNAEFVVPEAELRTLASGEGVADASAGDCDKHREHV